MKIGDRKNRFFLSPFLLIYNILYLYCKQHQLHKANNFKAAMQELEKNKKHISALDKLIEAAFEKNVPDKLRDDPFERMTANHEKEQREWIQAAAEADWRFTILYIQLHGFSLGFPGVIFQPVLIASVGIL